MYWSSKKPWAKGLIIGLIPLVLIITSILLLTILAFFVSYEYGLVIIYSLPTIFAAIIFSILFLIGSILTELYIKLKERKKLIGKLLILTIFLCLGFIGLLICGHIASEKRIDDINALWKLEHQQKIEKAEQLCGNISKDEITVIFYTKNGTITKEFQSEKEKFEYSKTIDVESIWSYNSLTKCLQSNNLPTNILN